MVRQKNNLRVKMLLTTAAMALVAVPSGAYAQDLVDGGDLVGAIDSAGNPGQITIANPSVTTATINVLAPTVIAEWVQFHVPTGTTLDITNGSAAAQATLLNRVIGAGASDISGTINAADVNLWLINQDGILFGSTAVVNANSFVGSTLDVVNSDFFDFGNGIDSAVNFAGASTAAITSLGGTITTDGTLFFASQGLDLDGTFDAGSGRAAFVAASDVDVNFTPGSPLAYTITGGTTVASQNVSGSVSGDSVDFQMVSAAGVVGALLQVDANVTATMATPTETGILLEASGLGADQPNVITNGVLNTSGLLEVSVDGDYTASQSLTGASVDIDAVGDVVLVDVAATSGYVDIEGESVVVTAVGALDLNTVTSTAGDINVTSVGTAELGSYNSAGAASVISTSGDVIITADSTSVGPTTLRSDTRSVLATATGALSGPGVSLTTTGAGSALNIDAGYFIKAGDLVSGGDIITDSGRETTLGTQTAAGSITATSARTYSSGLMTTTGAGGAIDVTAVRGASIAGYDSSDSVSIRATGAGGDVDITANSTSVGGASLISARGNVFATSTGTLGGTAVNLTTGAGSDLLIDADIRIKAGDLDAGGSITTDSGSTTLIGTQTAADSVTGSTDSGVYTSGLITTTTGGIDIDSDGTATIAGYDSGDTVSVVSATGNVAITVDSISDGAATLNSVTRSVFATTTGALDGPGVSLTTTDMNASIDIDAGFFLQAGDLDSGGYITTDSGRRASLGTQTAQGSITANAVGPGATYTSGLMTSGTGPIMVTSTETATIAGFDSGGSFEATSTDGDVKITEDSDSAGNTTLTSTMGSVNAQAITAGGDIDLNGNSSVVAGGLLMAGGAISADTSTGFILIGDATAGNGIALNSATSLTAGNLSATGGDITTVSVDNTLTGTQTADAGSITGTVTGAGSAYRSGALTTLPGAGNISVSSTGTATVAGYSSGGTATVQSDTGNVAITADSTSVGAGTLTATLGSVFATDTGTLGGTGVDVETTGTGSLLDIDAGVFIKTGDLESGGAITTDSVGRDTTTGTQMAALSITGNSGRAYTTGELTTVNGAINVTSARSATIAGYDANGANGDVNILSTQRDVILTEDSESTGTSTLTTTAGRVITEAVTTTGGMSDIVIDAGSSARANGELNAGQNVDVDANTSIDYTTLVAANNIDLMSGTYIRGGTQTAGGSILGNAGTTYNAGLLTTTTPGMGAINVTSAGTATIAGYDSDGTVDIASTGGNVVLTEDSESDGTSTLTTTSGAVITEAVTTTDATADIVINSGSSIRTNGDLIAGRNIDLDAQTTLMTASLTSTGGNITTDSVGNTRTGMQTATAGSITGNVTGAASTYTSGDLSSAGSITLTTTDGSITTGNAETTTLGSGINMFAGGPTSNIVTDNLNTNGGDILLSAGQNITTANVATALTGTPTAGSVGLYAGGSVSTGTVDAGEDVLAEAGTTVTMAGGSAGDDFTIIAGGPINVTGSITTTGTGVDLFELTTVGTPGTPGSIVFAPETMTGSNISITSTGGLANIDDVPDDASTNDLADDVLTIAGINSAGGISLTTSSGDIVLSGPVNTAGLVDLNTPNGDLIAGNINTTTAAGMVDIDSAATGNVYLGALDTSGDINVDATAINYGSLESDTNINLTSTTSIDGGTQMAGGVVNGAAGTTYNSGAITSVGLVNVTAGGSLTNLDEVNASNGDDDSDNDVADDAITIAGITSGATTTLSAVNGDIILSGGVNSDGLVTVNSAAGDVIADAITTTGAATNIDVDAANTGNVWVGTLDSTGDIDVNAVAIDYASLDADQDIFLTATESINGGTQMAGGSVNGNAGTTYNSGAITTVGAVNVTAGGSLTNIDDVAATSGNNDVTDDAITISSITSGSTTTLNAVNGDVILSSVDTAGLVTVSSASGDVIADTITTTGTATNIDIDAANTGNVWLGALDSTGDIDVDAVAIDYASLDADQDIFLTATESVNGGTQMAGGSVNGNAGKAYNSGVITTTTGSVNVTAGGSLTNIDDVAAAAGDNNLADDAITIAGIASANAINLTATNGDVILSGDATSVSTLNLNVAAGDIVAANVTTTGPSSGVNVSAANTGNVWMGNLDAQGNIVTNSAGLTSVGTQMAGGTISGTAGTTYNSGFMTANAAGPGALVVTAGGDATIAGYASNGTADVTSSGGNVALTAAAMSVGTSTLTAAGSVTTEAMTTTGTGADIVLDAGTFVTANDLLKAADDIDVDAGTSINYASLMAGGDIDLMAGTSINGGTQMAGGSVTGNAGTTYTSGLITTGTGSVTVTAGGLANIDDVPASAGANSVADDGISIAGINSADGISLNAANGDIVLSSAVTSVGTIALDVTSGDIVGADITTTGTASDIDVGAATTGNVWLGNLDATGNILTASTSLTSIGTQTADGSITGTAGTTYDSGLMTTEAPGAGAITVTSAGDATIAGYASNGTANITSSAGDVALTADATSVDTSTLTATTGSVATQAVTTTGSAADIILNAGMNIDSTGTLTAAGNVIGDAASGMMNLTDVVAGSAVDLSTGTTMTTQSTTAGTFADLDSGGNMTTTTIMTGGNLDLDSGGSIATAALDAGGDATLVAVSNVTTPSILSAGFIDVDSSNGGTLDVGTLDAGANIDLDTSGSVIAGMTTAGTVLSVGANALVGDATFTADATAASVDINTSGALTAQDIAATGGSVDIDSGSVMANALTASDDIFVDGAGAVNLASADAVDQLVIGATTPPSLVTVTGLSEAATVDITASGLVDLNTVNSTAGNIAVASISDSVVVDTASSTGGDAAFTAANNVTVGTVTSTGAIDVDSTNGGTLDMGMLNAGTSIDLDTSGSVVTGTLTAGTVLTIGGSTATADVSVNGSVTAGAMNVTSVGTFTSNAAIDAGNSATISSGDIDLAVGSSLNASEVLLRVSSSGQVILGEGTGVYVLSNDELSRVVTPDLVIDAESNDVGVADVTFSSGAGSTSFDVATVGQVNLTGDVTGDGAGRSFGFGGSADTIANGGSELASRVTADIDNASYDFGAATVIIRGEDIVFGREAFVNDVESRSTNEIAGSLIGNSSSALYNSLLNGQLSADRTADPIYLRAGNLVVVYENTALFQNTGLRTGGANQTIGVTIGQSSGNGTLTLTPTNSTNAFALFGQLNDLIGDTAAVAGPSVVIIDNTLQLGASRINGCQIGSGADCITTQVGTTTVDVPRETVNLLSADSDLSVPFDPLVGTSNEGLFSDAASSEANQDCQRNDAGECVAPQGSR